MALRQNHDAEIKRLEQTWKTHINKLEEQNEELFKRANEKFSSDLSGLEQKYLKKRYEPVCQEAEQKVLNCYIINKSQPLKCSNEVKEYSQCVKKIRKDYFNRNV